MTTTAASILRLRLPISDRYPVAAGVTFLVVAALALAGIGRGHPFGRVGIANLVTGMRGILTALVAGALLEVRSEDLAWALVVLAIAALVLDGFDGWAARRQGVVSAFGARFDMEVDALLILLLSLLAWMLGKAGPWIVVVGLLRYAFVAAGWLWPIFTRPLPPSFRRQAVCVIAGLALALLLAPPVLPQVSTAVALLALLPIVASFAIDTVWLLRHHPAA